MKLLFTDFNKSAKIVLILVCLLIPHLTNANINISGTISNDTIWSGDTIKIVGDVTLNHITLNIKSHTVIQFQGYYQIEADSSSIHAIGNKGDSIYFIVKDTTGFLSSPSTNNGGWKRIFCNEPLDSVSSTIFRFCVFKNIKKGSGLSISGINNSEISRCRFYNNFQQSITLNQSNTKIFSCLINNCYFATSIGGIIYMGGVISSNSSNPNIYSNTINGNRGHLIDYKNSGGLIQNNIIYKNTGNLGGSVMLIQYGNPVIVGNKICNNQGTVINTYEANPIVIDNLIANNSATNGGAFYSMNSVTTIVNNTIVNNAATYGGGMYCNLNSFAKLYNNIFYGNVASTSGNQVYLTGVHSSPDVNFCLMQGDSTAFGKAIGVKFTGNYTSNMNTNPLITKATAGAGTGFDAFGATIDWSLKQSSPIINKGLNEVPTITLPLTDIAGNTRISNSIIDMGAYETYINKITSSCTINSNTEWIADTVLVTCNVTVNYGVTLKINPRTTVKFMGYFGMKIFGTLDAQGTNDKNITFTYGKDTAGLFHVKDSTVGWKGVWFDNSDGKMDNNDSSILRYCNFQYLKIFGTAHNGLLFYDYNKVVVDNCTFNHNVSSGVIINLIYSNIRITNSKINNNILDPEGWYVLYTNGSELYLDGLQVINNDGHAPPIYILSSRSTTIVNSVIANNTGGGIWVNNSNLNIANCDIINNVGYLGYVPNSSSFTVKNSNVNVFNSILYGNVKGIHYNNSLQMLVYDDVSQVKVINSNFEKFDSSIYSGIVFQNVIDTDAMFLNPTVGAGSTIDASLSNWSLSPLSHCINTGINTYAGFTFPTLDYLSKPRLSGSNIDMGAIENQTGKVEIIKQPVGGSICEGKSFIFNISVKDTANYQWQKDGTDIPGAITAKYEISSVTEDDEGNYVCVASNAFGSTFSNAAFIKVRTAPEITDQPASTLVRKDDPILLQVKVDGSRPFHYRWTINGIDYPDSTAKFNIDNFKLENEGNYICEISNSCDTVKTDTMVLSLAPQICLITARDSTANIIVFEKGSNIIYKQYNIYREGIYSGVYEKLNSLTASQPGIFIDNIDPRAQAHLYKISGVKTNSTESDINLCNVHKTMHLRVSKGVPSGYQLDWDEYIGFPYSTYYIFRSVDGGKNFDTVHVMSSSTTSWTDYSAPSGYLLYYVAVNKGDTCFPEGRTKAGSDIYSQSVSNLEDNRIRSSGILKTEINEFNFACFPNPINEMATIRYNIYSKSHVVITLYNTLGSEIALIKDDELIPGPYTYQLNTCKLNLKSGVYILKFNAGSRSLERMLVITK